jgi:hypothetical protein
VAHPLLEVREADLTAEFPDGLILLVEDASGDNQTLQNGPESAKEGWTDRVALAKEEARSQLGRTVPTAALVKVAVGDAFREWCNGFIGRVPSASANDANGHSPRRWGELRSSDCRSFSLQRETLSDFELSLMLFSGEGGSSSSSSSSSSCPSEL